MEIIVGKMSGFCFGVENAVNKTTEILNKYGDTYCLGELVHNRQVINNLTNKGLNIIDDISKSQKRIIIRAHGEGINTYKKAKELGIEVIDLTCPKVIKIHKLAEDYANKGYYIFLIGNSNHPETIGTISYCGENVNLIEKEEDIKKGLEGLYSSNINKVVVLTQTTFSTEKFNKIIDIIENNIDKNIKMEIKRTICDSTRLRQEETKDISSKVDMMIVVGGKNSSNTNKLYDISKENCKNTILIEDSTELKVNELKKFMKIGIMAGASTPKESVETIVEMIKEIC